MSQNRGGVSTYAASGVLGNLWFMDNGSAQQTYYQDTTVFGSGQGLGMGGTEAGPFKFGGANGCQTDSDIGLVLMGHRYYDTRIGRFITQDPVGSGDNWYAYADNDPVDEVDPDGLMPMDGPGSSPVGSPGYADGAASGFGGSMDEFGVEWHQHFTGGPPLYRYEYPGGEYDVFPTYWAPDWNKVADLLGWLGPEFATEKVDPHRFDVLLGNGGTYLLTDPANGDKVMRTGRTNDLDARRGAHARQFPRLKFVIDKITNSYAEQRGREQMIQDLYKAPLDKIRGISWKNPKLFEYLEAAVKLIK